MKKKELWIGGYPSFFGGADTELDNLIDLWRMYDVDVNLVPMFGEDPKMRALCDQRGCKTHKYHPGIFKDKIVASFCNGSFLESLPAIMQHGKPRTVVWFNCMTWTFPLEVKAHQQGWIDLHGFVSKYQKGWLQPQLAKIAPVRELEGYRPYFNPTNKSQNVEFQYREPKEFFALGRCSRDDMHKYSEDMWNIFYKVCTPIPKKVFVLGYGPNAGKRTGPAPAGLDWQTWLPNAIPVKELYSRLHCIIHKTGGSRESYCRIVPEAYANGVPMIVEDDYAFPDLVVNGVTGYRCKSSDEMSYRASELAFDEPKRKKMIHAAYEHLLNDIANKDRCWEPWQNLFNEFGTEQVVMDSQLVGV